MTYKEFKDYVESKGVTNDTKLGYIDMNFGGKILIYVNKI